MAHKRRELVAVYVPITAGRYDDNRPGRAYRKAGYFTGKLVKKLGVEHVRRRAQLLTRMRYMKV